MEKLTVNKNIMLAHLKKINKENAYVTFEAGRLDTAKTVIFFSGKNINRFELLYDRDILKDNKKKHYGIIKFSNTTSMRLLILKNNTTRTEALNITEIQVSKSISVLPSSIIP